MSEERPPPRDDVVSSAAGLCKEGDREVVRLLASILQEVWSRRPADFSGAGLVVYRSLDDLPVVRLRPEPLDERLPLRDRDAIAEGLVRYSASRSRYHDGFHLMSGEGLLTHLSHYFAPPIDRALDGIPLNESFGGRFRSALYGSCLPAVVAAGIISQEYGPYLMLLGRWIPLAPTASGAVDAGAEQSGDST